MFRPLIVTYTIIGSRSRSNLYFVYYTDVNYYVLIMALNCIECLFYFEIALGIADRYHPCTIYPIFSTEILLLIIHE